MTTTPIDLATRGQPCPQCGARAGQPCAAPNGKPGRTHAARKQQLASR